MIVTHNFLYITHKYTLCVMIFLKFFINFLCRFSSYNYDDLIKIQDQRLNLKKNDDLDTDNITIDDDLINIIENNANDEKYSLILTIVFSIFVSFLLFIQY